MKKRVTLLVSFDVYEEDKDSDAIYEVEEMLEKLPGFCEVQHSSAYPHVKTIEEDEAQEYDRYQFDWFKVDSDISGEDFSDMEDQRENPLRPLRPSDFPDNQNYRKFIRAMKSISVGCEFYHGRFYYEGPAVRTDVEEGLDKQTILSAAEMAGVAVQVDTMGCSDVIIYHR